MIEALTGAKISKGKKKFKISRKQNQSQLLPGDKHKKAHTSVPSFGAPVWTAAQAARLAGLQPLLCYTCSYSALEAAWPVLKQRVNINFYLRVGT